MLLKMVDLVNRFGCTKFLTILTKRRGLLSPFRPMYRSLKAMIITTQDEGIRRLKFEVVECNTISTRPSGMSNEVLADIQVYLT